VQGGFAQQSGDTDPEALGLLAQLVEIGRGEPDVNPLGELARFALDPAHVHSFGTVDVVALPGGMSLVYGINALI
jgi:hypothetical protein